MCRNERGAAKKKKKHREQSERNQGSWLFCLKLAPVVLHPHTFIGHQILSVPQPRYFWTRFMFLTPGKCLFKGPWRCSYLLRTKKKKKLATT